LRRIVFGLAIVALASCFDWAALSPTTLELDGGCAALGAPGGGSISMSGMAFTVAFWMQIDTATSGPIVWQGGTAVGEAGWSFSVDSNGPKVSFCLANETTAPRCLSAPISLHHAIHVAATTTPGVVDFTRVVNLYMLDATNNQTTHSLVGMDNAGVNMWSSMFVFTLGGAYTDGGCTRTSPVTLGGVRVWPMALDMSTLDQNLKVASSCGGLADFRLDEGSGTTAGDCNKTEPALTLIQPFAWVTSPFL
jgi:hypothetical protein